MHAESEKRAEQRNTVDVVDIFFRLHEPNYYAAVQKQNLFI